MKRNAWLILITAVIWTSCNLSEEQRVPNDLEGQRKMLSEKKKQLKSLKDDIDTLEKLIAEATGEKAEDLYVRVEVDTLKKGNFEKFITLPAQVITDDRVAVSSETGGRIIQLNISEGDVVRKGEVIAKLDLESLNLQKAEIEKRFELARTVYERQKRLWDQQIGSEIQYLEAKNNVEAMEKSLASLEDQLKKAVVTAPISGVIENKLSRQGEVISPGQPMLYMLNNNRIKVQTDVPEAYLNSIRKGQMINIYFPALDREENARVSRIGSSINPANRSFKVEIEMANPGSVLKPNMLAEVKILEDERSESISLLVDYIQQEVGGKKYVYVLDNKVDPPKAQKRYITTGISYQNKIVIEEGLVGGEFIITKGGFDIKDGQKLQIVN